MQERHHKKLERALQVFLDDTSEEARDLESLIRAHPDLEEELRSLDAAALANRVGLDHVREERRAENARANAILVQLGKEKGRPDRYRLEGELGRGGMGVVYRVWDQTLDRPLAMKVIRQAVESKSTHTTAAVRSHHLARFINEAQTTAQLEHPGIVPVHDLGVDDARGIYFTMKLVQGIALHESLVRHALGDTEWSAQRVLQVLMRLCDAMAYAHDRGVIHRDLKPHNIMVGTFGEVYVMDWGVARDVTPAAPQATGHSSSHRAATIDQTLDGEVIGTPSYMSPEQARGDITAMGPASDVYAIGAMLYQLLIGHPPYAGPGRDASSSEILARVLEGRLDVIPVGAAPPDLIAVCQKAMSVGAKDRYANASELAHDLGRFLDGRVVHALSSGPWTELRKWIKRNAALALSFASTIVVLAAGLVVALYLRGDALDNLELAEERRDAAVEQTNAVLDNMLMLHWGPGDDERGPLPRFLDVLFGQGVEKISTVKQSGTAQPIEWMPSPRDDIRLLRYWAGWVGTHTIYEEHRALIFRVHPFELLGDIPVHHSRSSDLSFQYDDKEGLEVTEHDVALAWTADSLYYFDECEDFGKTIGQVRLTGPADASAQVDLSYQEARSLIKDGACRVLGENVAALDALPHVYWAGGTTPHLSLACALLDGLCNCRPHDLSTDFSVPEVENPDYAARWEQATTAIAGAYPDIELRAQDQLLPIGTDPKTGLWEFWCVPTGTEPKRNEAGDLLINELTGLVFVLLPGGALEVGDAASGDAREVFVSPFYMSKYKMTRGQWHRMDGTLPAWQSEVDTLCCSISDVTWLECREVLGPFLDLPTEAQWEYACRSTFFCEGEEIESGKVCESHLLPKNGLGLHGMQAGVGEWCLDGVEGPLPSAAVKFGRVFYSLGPPISNPATSTSLYPWETYSVGVRPVIEVDKW